MPIPNASEAEVESAKLSDYLLSTTHPRGKWKAFFFRQLGFHPENAAELRTELLRIAREQPVSETIITAYGTKYVVDGVLIGPWGIATVRTIWIRERDALGPRFVTAYPQEA